MKKIECLHLKGIQMKKSVISVVLVMMTAASLIGCDSNPFKGEPDPLAKKSDEVKNAQKPGPVKEPEKPLAENILQIDSESGYFVFVDGVSQEITISGRSFFENSLFNLEILNIADFENATVDYVQGDKAADVAATAKMKWEPHLTLGVNEQTVMNLDVMISTNFQGNVYSYRRSIPVFIYRKDVRVPKILKVTGAGGSIIENGAPVTLTVDVEDKESQNRDGFRPTLMFQPRYIGNGLSLAQFIKQDKVELVDEAAGLWKITAIINLNGAELTPGYTSGYFSTAVISSSGIRSPLQDSFLRVLTSVTQPAITWNGPVNFKAGKDNVLSFTVYDPKSENNITAELKTDCARLPGKATCSCNKIPDLKVKDKSTATVCQIQWSVPNDIEDGTTQFFEIGYVNKSINKNEDTTEITGTFVGVINIESTVVKFGPQ